MRLTGAAANDPDAPEFCEIVWADPLVRGALQAARALQLPQCRIVSGVLYNAVWNHLTGQPSGTGTKDIDVIYFDNTDLSYEAEDRHIKRAEAAFADLPVPVELRNQARVHLWYRRRFGEEYPALSCADDSLERYASLCHAAGLRLEADGALDVIAPFGLADIMQMRVRPNRRMDNRRTHEEKAARTLIHWPELTVEPW